MSSRSRIITALLAVFMLTSGGAAGAMADSMSTQYAAKEKAAAEAPGVQDPCRPGDRHCDNNDCRHNSRNCGNDHCRHNSRNCGNDHCWHNSRNCADPSPR